MPALHVPKSPYKYLREWMRFSGCRYSPCRSGGATREFLSEVLADATVAVDVHRDLEHGAQALYFVWRFLRDPIVGGNLGRVLLKLVPMGIWDVGLTKGLLERAYWFLKMDEAKADIAQQAWNARRQSDLGVAVLGRLYNFRCSRRASPNRTFSRLPPKGLGLSLTDMAFMSS